MRFRSSILALGLVAALAAAGCTPPVGVRRTLLSPAVTPPSRTGAPLHAQHGRAGLALGTLELPSGDALISELRTPALGDPGVLVPQGELDAFGHFAFTDVVEVGGRVGFTHAGWSRRNVRGVIELPEQRSGTQWSAAVGARLNLELMDEERLVLSPIVELQLSLVQEAVFCRADLCDGAPSADPDYLLYDYTSTPFLIPDVALQLGTRFSRPFFVDLVVGTQPSVKNVGFDDLANVDADTTGLYWTVYAGPGIDLQLDWFFAVLHLYLVLDGEPKIGHGLRTSLQLGYAF